MVSDIVNGVNIEISIIIESNIVETLKLLIVDLKFINKIMCRF